MDKETAFAGTHSVVPLPFDPAKLKGISERPIFPHLENDYGIAVKILNRIEEELARITGDTPPFVTAGLKNLSEAAKCVDVFYQNINWDEVNRRLEYAENANAAFGA